MGDITNVQIGACSVTYKGVDLGHTKGGEEFTYEPEYHDITVDKYGNSVVEQVLMGEKVMIKVQLAEFTLANLGVAIPQGEWAGAANARRTIGAVAGKRQLTDAGLLVVHPLNEGTRRHDIVLYKAIVAESITIPHKNDEEKVIEVTFLGLVDESRSDGNYIGLIGDSTA